MALSRKPDRHSTNQNNLSYYLGDTWQYWIGPQLDPLAPNYTEVADAVRRVFQSYNKIKEVVDRHRRALVSKPPKWYLTVDGDRPPEGDTSLEPLEKQLTRLMHRFKQLASGQENRLSDPVSIAVNHRLIGQGTALDSLEGYEEQGTGYLRLWSPKRFANAAEPVMRLALHSPDPSSVTIKRDGDGFVEKIEYRYRHENQTRIETQFIDPKTQETVFQITDEGGVAIADDDGETEIRLNLGGRFTIYEIKGAPLITESIRQSQNAINYLLTLMMRNQEYAGFLERIITNGMPPGDWVEDKTVQGGMRFVPSPNGLEVGPGITTQQAGMPIFDENGNITSYTTPGISYRNPVPVNSFLDSIRSFVAAIYEQVGQGHLLGVDAILSGISRVQLRQDFETMLAEDASSIAAALSGIYGAAFMMLNQERAAEFMGLDVVLELQLSVSRPTPEETREIRENYNAKLLSRTSAMSGIGVADTDAEAALIDEEMAEQTARVPVSPVGEPLNRPDFAANGNGRN